MFRDLFQDRATGRLPRLKYLIYMIALISFLYAAGEILHVVFPTPSDQEVGASPAWYLAFAPFLFPSIFAMIAVIGKRANDIGWPQLLVLLVLLMPQIAGEVILLTGRATEVTPVVYLSFAWLLYLALVPSKPAEADTELALPAAGGAETGDPRS